MNGMYPVIFFYGIWLIGFIVLFLLGWAYYDKRYKSRTNADDSQPSNGFVWTAEVFIDPKDGFTYRVYYNPRTGDREYVREK